MAEEEEIKLNEPINIHRKKPMVVNAIFAQLFEELIEDKNDEPHSAAKKKA